jgi:hypothetical protein
MTCFPDEFIANPSGRLFKVLDRFGGQILTADHVIKDKAIRANPNGGFGFMTEDAWYIVAAESDGWSWGPWTVEWIEENEDSPILPSPDSLEELLS